MLQVGDSAFSLDSLDSANNHQIRRYFKDYLKYLKLQKDRQTLQKHNHLHKQHLMDFSHIQQQLSKIEVIGDELGDIALRHEDTLK